MKIKKYLPVSNIAGEKSNSACSGRLCSWKNKSEGDQALLSQKSTGNATLTRRVFRFLLYSSHWQCLVHAEKNLSSII